MQDKYHSPERIAYNMSMLFLPSLITHNSLFPFPLHSIRDRLSTAFLMMLMLLLPFSLVSTTGCRSVEKGKNNGITTDKRIEPDTTQVLAGISVSALNSRQSRATRYFWGISHTYKPSSTFADLLSHLLTDRYKMQTLRVKDAPDMENLLFDEAKKLELDYLFAAEINSWYQSYLLFFQWANIHFTLTCYDVQSGERIWFSEVNLTNVYDTSREVLWEALEDVLSRKFHKPTTRR